METLNIKINLGAIRPLIEQFFMENNMKDLMDCGETGNEGLYDISQVYKDILEEKFGFTVPDCYAEEGLSTVKYIIHFPEGIEGLTKEEKVLEVKASYDVEDVIDDFVDLFEEEGVLYEPNYYYDVEISLIIEGSYYPNSDISIGNFDTYKEAKDIADAISVQDDKLYECYIYKYDEQGNLIKDWRIF